MDRFIVGSGVGWKILNELNIVYSYIQRLAKIEYTERDEGKENWQRTGY